MTRVPTWLAWKTTKLLVLLQLGLPYRVCTCTETVLAYSYPLAFLSLGCRQPDGMLNSGLARVHRRGPKSRIDGCLSLLGGYRPRSSPACDRAEAGDTESPRPRAKHSLRKLSYVFELEADPQHP